MTETVHHHQIEQAYQPWQPQVLPRVEFVAGVDPALAAHLAPQLENRPAQIVEIAKTPEEEQQLHDMKDAWVRFGLELGVDLSQRRPSNNMVHFIDDDTVQQVRDRDNKPGWEGGIDDTGNMFVRGNPLAWRKMELANHEIGHAFGHYSWKVEQFPDGTVDAKRAQLGYKDINTGGFHTLNEIVTQKMSEVVQESYWPKYGSLAPLARSRVRGIGLQQEDYGDAMSLGDEIVAKVAHRTKQLPDQVWGKFMKGMLTGDMNELQPLFDTFGHAGVQALANLRSSDYASVANTAAAMGITFGENQPLAMSYKGQVMMPSGELRDPLPR